MRIFKRIYSVVYFVLIAFLAVSTFCPPTVYGTWWFTLLWALFAGGLLWIICRMKLWRNLGVFVLHVSFLIILMGGLITKLTAREGTLLLSEGRVERDYMNREELHPLGFEIQLDSFEIQHYVGGRVVRDYVSHVTIDGEQKTLSVNKPLSVNGLRLYQASYVDDNTPILGVRSDGAGRAITFCGYALFLIGGLICMFKHRGAAAAMLFLCISFPMEASVPVLTPEKADSLAREQVLYNGRVVTMSTVCHDVLQKVYGKSRYKGLNAERTVMSLMLFPEEWSAQPVIKHGREHVSLQDCFDFKGNYVMTSDAAADERVGILLMLYDGQMFQRSEPILSSAHVEAEILYNHIPATLVIFISLFLCAALSFFRPKWARGAGFVILAAQLVVIGVEWWLTGHGPFASTFETLQLLVVVTLVISLLMRGALSIGLLASGCMALVAHLQASNPIVTPLMPVLHSPWLSMHVTLVMTAYSLLVLASVMAACGIVRPSVREEMTRRAMMLLRPGVYLLGLGIFSGAVWADVSWGRYWGWDPKETWALVTFMLYAVPLHSRKPSPWWIFLPVLSVAMTYFGVNYLPSLHAYN